MSEDATSQPSEQPDSSPATEEDTAKAQQLLAEAVDQTTADDASSGTDTTEDKPDTEPKTADDTLGASGKRALTEERRARREAERQVKALRERLQQYEDRDKSELQKAQEAAQRYQQELRATRVANARLMAAAAHNLPPEAIDLLGDGTEEEIDARAQRLAAMLAAAAPAASEQPKRPPATRPVESLTPGAKPASEEPEDPNAWLRRMAGRAP